MSTAEITSLAKVLSDSPTAALHQWPVLRLALAAVAALTGPAAGKWALLGKQEKQLAMIGTEGGWLALYVCSDDRRCSTCLVHSKLETAEPMVLCHQANAYLARCDTLVQ